MKKTSEVELDQLKQAISAIVDGLDRLSLIYLQEAKKSPLKEYLLGCERVAGDQAEVLRRLPDEITKLRADADADTIRAVVVRVVQSASNRRKSDEDLTIETLARLQGKILGGGEDE